MITDELAINKRSKLRRCLGPLSTMAQAIATMGLTITATINIPQAYTAGAATATWQSYAVAMALMLLVAETLVLFRHHPAEANGIAGFVKAGLGQRTTSLASWALLLGYGSIFVACLAFFSAFAALLLGDLGITASTTVVFLSVGWGCLELARRDVKLSANTMLIAEGISVLLVIGLCITILQNGVSTSTLISAEQNPARASSGLMLAVFSFIGFESAANLGEEAKTPDQSVPFALRYSVILAGCMFLFWAWVIAQGLETLPLAARTGSDPLAALAKSLGEGAEGSLIMLGAALSLFGSGLGSLTALGRIVYSLAKYGLLPEKLSRIHPSLQTPSFALFFSAVPLTLIGAGLITCGHSAQSIYDGFGGFSVMAFLLVYGLVAGSALLRPLHSIHRLRRWLIAGACLTAITGVFISYIKGIWTLQPQLIASFAAAMGAGAVLSWHTAPSENVRSKHSD